MHTAAVTQSAQRQFSATGLRTITFTARGATCLLSTSRSHNAYPVNISSPTTPGQVWTSVKSMGSSASSLTLDQYFQATRITSQASTTPSLTSPLICEMFSTTQHPPSIEAQPHLTTKVTPSWATETPKSSCFPCLSHHLKDFAIT